MNARPLTDTPVAEENRCSTHPDRPVLGACARCGAFYCEDDHRVLHGKAFCAACAARPDVDYLEGFRRQYWGRRDGWAWVVGAVTVPGVLASLSALAGDSPEGGLLGVFWLATAGVCACFWLGLPWARLGLVMISILSMCVGLVTSGVGGLLAGGVPLIFSIIIFDDTRNRLFFQDEVPRDALEAMWNRYANNPLARGGLIAGVVGLLFPGVGLMGLVWSLIGLLRVDPHAHPPVGRRRQAVAGIILGTVGTLLWGAWMAYRYLNKR